VEALELVRDIDEEASVISWLERDVVPDTSLTPTPILPPASALDDAPTLPIDAVVISLIALPPTDLFGRTVLQRMRHEVPPVIYCSLRPEKPPLGRRQRTLALLVAGDVDQAVCSGALPQVGCWVIAGFLSGSLQAAFDAGNGRMA
jgi:hypothetical protein